MAIHYHARAGADAGGDDCDAILNPVDSDGLAQCVVTGADHIHISSRLRAHDCGVRHGDGVMAGTQVPADVDILTRPELVLRIGKVGFQLYGAAAGVNLVVDHRQLTARQHFAGVMVVGLGDERFATGVDGAVDGLKILLGQREDRNDRVDLIDNDQPVGVTGLHHITRVDQPRTDAS